MIMQNADMEFVTFDAQDVIATSGKFSLNATSTYQFVNLTDTTAKNGYIQETTLGGTTYTWYMYDEDGNLATLPANLSTETMVYANGLGKKGAALSTLMDWDSTGKSVVDAYNAIFEWLDNNKFVKQ